MPSENPTPLEIIGGTSAIVGLGGGILGMALQDIPGLVETANTCGKAGIVGLILTACYIKIDMALKNRTPGQ